MGRSTDNVARPPASTRFDDLIPPWLFCVRGPLAQVLVAVAAPAAALLPLVHFADPTDVRFGPLLALAAIVIAATTSWWATLLGGTLIEAAYWRWGVPPRDTFDLPGAGSVASVLGMAVLVGGLVLLTRRIEDTVDQVRDLDVQRRRDLERSDALANQLAAALRTGNALAGCETRAAVAEALLRSMSLPEPPTTGSIAMVEGQHLRILAACGSTPEIVTRVEGVDLTTSSWLSEVLAGQPVFVEHREEFAAEHPNARVLDLFPSGSWLVLPFRTEGSIGMLSLHYAEPQALRELEAYFFLVAELLATSLARAGSEEGRLAELHHLEQSFAERDRIARTLSTSLIPPVLPELHGFGAAGWLEPASADEVAGDFYDLFPVGRDWVAVLGDVAGKGAEAAAVTSLARYAARAAALSTSDPRDVVDLVDRALSADPSDLLCTVAVVRYCDAQEQIEVVLAGHHKARVIGSDGVRRVGAYGSAAGLGLGTFTGEVTPFGPGDLLLLFSDGVIERDPAFGHDELDEVLAAAPRDPHGLVEHLRRSIEGLDPMRPDDIAVLVVQRRDQP
jgi:sigma-B regulation protein RsbU (phosphoserine phosphatase)